MTLHDLQTRYTIADALQLHQYLDVIDDAMRAEHEKRERARRAMTPRGRRR